MSTGNYKGLRLLNLASQPLALQIVAHHRSAVTQKSLSSVIARIQCQLLLREAVLLRSVRPYFRY